MTQFAYFLGVYSVMLFIWSYVYANTRKGDGINRAFLMFLGMILLWVLLSASCPYLANNWLGVFLKSLYFISMLNISVVFLHFVYELIHRPYDSAFYITVALNVVTVFTRYFFPIDFSLPNFWRMDQYNLPVATVMAAIFTLPMLWAFILIVKQYLSTASQKLKVQLKYVLYGIALGTIVSICSEFLIPAFTQSSRQFSLMYVAILLFVFYMFLAIVKYQFLNVQVAHAYQKLFQHSNEGIIMIDRNLSVLSINDAAKAILKCSDHQDFMSIADYIGDYDFDENYNQREVTVLIAGEPHYLMISQSPVEAGERMDVKLLHIVDITRAKLDIEVEKEHLIKQTTIDPLSGLYNKSYYLECCADQKAKANETNAVLFIDIDDFKSINDKLGHMVGDQVIKAVADSITSSLRHGERAFRYGGDEFLILSENTSTASAYQLAVVIADKVNRLATGQRMPQVTLSIGLSEGSDEVSVLTQQADAAMYHAKFHGKNRTTIFDKAMMAGQ